MSKWDTFYAKGGSFKPVPKVLLKKSVSSLSSSNSKAALDFGCGAGDNSSALNELGFDVLGVDKSPEAIRAAKSNYPDLKFEVSDEDMSSNSKYDVVLVALVYKFIEDKDSFLKTLHKSLSNNGIVIMYNPTKSIKDIAIDSKLLDASAKKAGFNKIDLVDTSEYDNITLELKVLHK